MTNIVLVCAVYKSIDRMTSLITSLRNAAMIEDIQCIFVNTGDVVPYFFRAVEILPSARVMQIKPERRRYDSIMREKVAAVAGYCNPETILVSTDDDYVFGTHAFPWILKIFNENPQVQYMSMLRTALPPVTYEEVELSGFPFLKVGSMMGGSMVVNAYDFFEHVDEYWEGTIDDPMFDQGFFRTIKRWTQGQAPVYMPRDFSVAQHINFVSNYIEMKDGPDDFMAGINFIEERNLLEGE